MRVLEITRERIGTNELISPQCEGVTPLLFLYIELRAKFIIFAAPYKAKCQNVGLRVCIFQRYIHSPPKKIEKKKNMSKIAFFAKNNQQVP